MPKPGSPSDSKGKQSSSRQQAGKDLQEAARKVTEAGKQIGDMYPQQKQQQKGEDDPLVPKGEGESESEVFADLDAETGPSGESANDDEAAQASAEDDPLTEEIRAAQEALEEAGIALETAGAQLETATTDEEIKAAEASLSKARVSVIVAGQDLLELKKILEGEVDIFGDEGDILTDQAILESVIGDTEEVLDEANVSIVIATQSILDILPDLPSFPQIFSLPGGQRGQQSGSGKPGGKTGQMDKTGQLDKELNESLIIFDGQIQEARRVLTDTPSGLPQGDNSVFSSPDDSDTGSEPGDDTADTIAQQGRMPEGTAPQEDMDIASNVQVPEDLPDPQGDDIVAKQLREAAIAETDQVLKEKLWEEYRRYREGL